jgi:hypothetical protein
MGARAPSHFVAAHDASVLIIRSYVVGRRCVHVAVLFGVLLGRSGRESPALASARAIRQVSV